MSFILDALKKSEAERKRQDTPGIANIPDARQPAGKSKWGLVIGILLAINLVVMFVFLKRPSQEPESAQTRQPAVSIVPAPEAPVERQPVTPAVPAAATAIETADETPAPAEVADSDPAEAPALPARERTARVAQPATNDLPTVSVGLATLTEMQARGVVSLPDLHLDIHVYSGEPDDRFVFINMAKYKERGRLAEGPVVREITPDGVVLEHQGAMFLLPRE